MRDALGEAQSVLVLGGTSEIGVATAKALVARRAKTVVLAARDTSRCADAVAELEALGADTVEAIEFDALDTDSHERFVEYAHERFGDIDVALVAFGVLGDGDEVSAAELMQVNTVGAVSAMAPLAELMKRQGHGSIVLLSSVAGERVRKSNYPYGASKAGADGYAQGLGDALAGSGVHVMVVRPGFVKTKMTAHLDPVPFSTTADAVAAEVVKGLARGAHTVWAPPVLRFVMTGLRHVPRPLFRRLPI